MYILLLLLHLYANALSSDNKNGFISVSRELTNSISELFDKVENTLDNSSIGVYENGMYNLYGLNYFAYMFAMNANINSKNDLKCGTQKSTSKIRSQGCLDSQEQANAKFDEYEIERNQYGFADDSKPNNFAEVLRTIKMKHLRNGDNAEIIIQNEINNLIDAIEITVDHANRRIRDMRENKHENQIKCLKGQISLLSANLMDAAYRNIGTKMSQKMHKQVKNIIKQKTRLLKQNMISIFKRFDYSLEEVEKINVEILKEAQNALKQKFTQSEKRSVTLEPIDLHPLITYSDHMKESIVLLANEASQLVKLSANDIALSVAEICDNQYDFLYLNEILEDIFGKFWIDMSAHFQDDYVLVHEITEIESRRCFVMIEAEIKDKWFMIDNDIKQVQSGNM